jgi:hypothetical protein
MSSPASRNNTFLSNSARSFSGNAISMPKLALPSAMSDCAGADDRTAHDTKRSIPERRSAMPNQTVPTYEDASLVLKLYELRREEKLRAARDWFTGKFFPQTAQDVTALTGAENVYYRMVTTYWEMAASFVARGVLNADLFLDSGGEMIVVWTKLTDFVPQLRQNIGSENLLKHVESVIASSPRAKERVGVTRQRIAQVRERALAAASKA